MNKKNRLKSRFSALIIAALSFISFFAACSDLDIEKKEEVSSVSSRGVSLSVNFDNSKNRAAFPEIDSDEFISITLYYEEKDSANEDERYYINSWKNLEEMKDSEIPFKTGTYEFTLLALNSGMLFSETKTYTIKDGNNSLSFTPKLQYIKESGGKGNLSVTINYDNEQVGLVTAGLYSLEGNKILGFGDEELAIEAGGKSKYEKENVPGGSYLVVFKFYKDAEKKLFLATYREYASIVNEKLSSSECTITAFGNLFSINYELNGGTFTNGVTAAGEYTRQSASVELPLSENVSKDNCVFAGWYDNKDFIGEPVLSIPAGSTGNKTFYAKWLQNLTISFVPNLTDASISKTTQVVQKGIETNLCTANELSLNSDGEHRFLGWAEDSSSNKIDYMDGGSITIESNKTLYAIWSVSGINPRDESDSADSDEDGLSDWEELNKFYTDPSNRDTDGDGWNDGEECSLYNKDTNVFSPLIADTPCLDVVFCGKPSFSYKYTYSNGSSSSETISNNEGTTGSSSSSNSNTKSHSETHGWNVKVSGGVKISDKGIGFSAGMDLGYNGSVSNGDNYTYSSSTSEGWSKSWSNGKTTASNSSKTVTGGGMKFQVKFRNPSNIAYNVDTVTLSVNNIPVGSSQASSVTSVTLSNVGVIPAGSESGVFNISADLSIAATEQLMKWSNGIVVQIAGYRISSQTADNSDNNFTESLTKVKAQTAAVYIDFGVGNGKHPVTYNVAVKNQYNKDSTTINDLYTRQNLKYVFDTILNLDYTSSDAGYLNSIYGIQNKSNPKEGSWFISHKYTKNGERLMDIFPPQDSSSLADIEISAGDEIYIIYTVDKDEDNVPLNEELIYGTSDENQDTDGDGLSDFEEIYGWYKAGIGLDSKYSDSNKIYTNPLLKDTDGDDLLDYSGNAEQQDDDPCYAKQKNDASLGSCSYAKSNGGTFSSFEFNGTSASLSNLNEYIWLDIQPKVSFATIKYKLGSSGTYSELDKSTAIPLNVGENKIYIQCTAPDGVTTKEYILTVNSVFHTLSGFKAESPKLGSGRVNFTYDSYTDSRASASDGGYILYAKKENSLTSKTLSRSEIAGASTETGINLKNRTEFYLKLESTDFARGFFSLENLATHTNYTLCLFAYAHNSSDSTFKSELLASANLKTGVSDVGVLKFYAHCVYDYEDQDGGCNPQYYWNFNGGKLDLSSLNISSDEKKEFDDDDDKSYCFGEGKIHKYGNDPLRFSGCTKTISQNFDRYKDYSFTATWEATEYDKGSADDYLGKVTANFKYSSATDTWTCSWYSTCGASGSSSITSGERTGTDSGGYADGKRWELHNSSEGEIDFLWDWSWDYDD